MITHRMNDDGLLECPFCGGDAYLSTSKSGWSYVTCSDCGAGSDERLSIIRAKNSWNTRNGKLYTVESMRRADEEGDME